MSGPILYTVQCRCPSAEKAALWVAWLRGGHIGEVLGAGASSAAIIRLDPESNDENDQGVTLQVQYRFNDRSTYQQYIDDHAPRLRAEGLERFPADDGFVYSRTVGTIIG